MNAFAQFILMAVPAFAVVACSHSPLPIDDLSILGEWRRIGGAQSMVFDGADGISGNAGCNAYSASITRSAEGAMRMGPVLATKRACADGRLMRDETAFLRALELIRTFRVDSQGRLVLADESGTGVLTFERPLAHT